ncbi:hypothetical protein CBL_06226 [Carabus blaptoides fortunei]
MGSLALAMPYIPVQPRAVLTGARGSRGGCTMPRRGWGKERDRTPGAGQKSALDLQRATQNGYDSRYSNIYLPTYTATCQHHKEKTKASVSNIPVIGQENLA